MHVHHTFLYISLPSLHDYNVKMPKFTFCPGQEHKTTTFFFSSWTLIQSLRIQLQKRFFNIWRGKRDGIRAIKFKVTRLHFLSDVFVAVAVVVALARCSNHYCACPDSRGHAVADAEKAGIYLKVSESVPVFRLLNLSTQIYTMQLKPRRDHKTPYIWKFIDGQFFEFGNSATPISMTDQSDDEFDHDDWKYLLVKEKELLCWWEVSKFRRAALFANARKVQSCPILPHCYGPLEQLTDRTLRTNHQHC